LSFTRRENMFKEPGTGLEKRCSVRDQPLGAARGGKPRCG
jgi:hypothetical protein